MGRVGPPPFTVFPPAAYSDGAVPAQAKARVVTSYPKITGQSIQSREERNALGIITRVFSYQPFSWWRTEHDYKEYIVDSEDGGVEYEVLAREENIVWGCRFMPLPDKALLDEKCIICQETVNVLDGPLERGRCGSNECQAFTHARCWNIHLEQDAISRHMFEGREQVGSKIPKCPLCRRELNAGNKARDIMKGVHIVDSKSPDKITLSDEEVKEGYDIVVNPWLLYISGDAHVHRDHRYLISGLATGAYECMRVDDEIVARHSYLFKVRRGIGQYWPRTWGSFRRVHEAGVCAIRSLHAGVDFNWDWVREQMRSTLTSGGQPAWEGIDIDISTWIASDVAMRAYEDRLLRILSLRDKAMRMKWLRQSLDTTMSSRAIGWLYKYEWVVNLLNLCWWAMVVLTPMWFFWLVYSPSPKTVLALSSWILGLFKFAQVIGKVPRIPKIALKVANVVEVFRSCSYGIPVPALHPKAKLKEPAGITCRCDPKKVKKVGVYGCIMSCVPFVVPSGCIHDISNGLRIRFLFDRTVSEPICKEFYKYCKVFLSKVFWAPFYMFTHETWLGHLAAKRRNVLLSEDDNSGVRSKNWPADIFVKMEAYVARTWDAWKPRIIQCRKSPLQILIGSFFYAIYKWLLMTFGKKHKDSFATSMTALELGSRLLLMFGRGRVFEGDASNFDGSVSEVCLKVEKYLLRHIVPYNPSWLKDLLKGWTKTSGASKGVRYSCSWGRRSGDMWTSAFNTLLNILISNFAWGETVEGVYNGDDNFICVKHHASLPLAMERYAGLGFKMEIFERKHWRDVTFCSGRFYMTNRGVKWGLLPFRQLAKFGVNFHNHSVKVHKRLLLGNALSMLPIAGHVPVFGVFLRSIVNSARGIKPSFVDGKREEWQITDSEVDAIHPEEERYFCERYGLSSEDYDRLVAWAEGITIDDFPMVLDDPLFERGVRVDLGIGMKKLRLDAVNHTSWFHAEPRPASVVEVVGPALEEVLCFHFPWMWSVLACLEFSCGSLYAPVVHFCFAQLRRYVGWPVAAIAHYVFNYVVRNYIHQANVLAIRVVGPRQHVVYRGNSLAMCRTLKDAWVGAARLAALYYLLIKKTVKTLIVRSSGREKPQKVVLAGVRQRKGRRRKRTNRNNRFGSLSFARRQFILSQFNPFLTECDGVRLPDDFAYPSATMVARSSWNFTGESAAGNYIGARMFTWKVRGGFFSPGLIDAAGTITWGGGAANSLGMYAGFQNYATTYRVVAWGIRVTTESALTSTSGHIWVMQFPQNLYFDSTGYTDAPTTEAQIAQYPMSTKYALTELAERPLVIPAKRVDNGSYRFHAVDEYATAATSETTFGWCNILLYYNGAAVGTIPTINVEYVAHYEYVPNPANGTYYGIGTSMPCPPDQISLEEGVLVQQTTPVAHFEDAQEEADGDSVLETILDYAGRTAKAFANSSMGVSLANQLMDRMLGSRRAHPTSFIQASARNLIE